MRTLTVALVAAALSLPFAVAIPSPVEARSYKEYCEDRARDLSGYRGNRGRVTAGAIRGGLEAAIIAGALGANRAERRRAARIGAVIGGLSKARRPNSRKARIYRLEYENCMRRRFR
ncbi:MAG: hypothetical protein Alpg2KO_00330 [Alphaproteobacteria bacterium]